MAKTTWKLGKVRWFDNLKGEGLIRDQSGNCYFVHYSAIQSAKQRKTLQKEEEVKFQLLEDSHYTHVAKVKEI